jgi:hypothetical protein
MGNQPINQIKNRIVYLDEDEINSPMKPVKAFFDAEFLSGQLKMLKEWRNDVCFERNHPSKGNPSDRIYDHELTMKLVEAAWLMRKKELAKLDINIQGDQTIAKWYIKNEQKKMSHYPKNLTINEIINPSKVVRKVFKNYKLNDYNKILKDWLYDSLNQKCKNDCLSTEQVILTYENMVKLFEAMFLISERTVSERGPITLNL